MGIKPEVVSWIYYIVSFWQSVTLFVPSVTMTTIFASWNFPCGIYLWTPFKLIKGVAHEIRLDDFTNGPRGPGVIALKIFGKCS